MFRNLITIICLVSVIGCGRFDKQLTSITSSDDNAYLSVNCIRLNGVPFMCAVVSQTTKTIRIEDVVTNIVERIVKKEVVSEVPINKIVQRIETKYVETGIDVDIAEIVKRVIERIEVYVDQKDLIDIPIDDIIDETTDLIQNPPTNPGNNPDNITPTPQPGEDKDGEDPISEEEDILNENPLFDEKTYKLRVVIGPRPIDDPIQRLSQPGLTYSVACNIDNNLVYPDLDGYSLFNGKKENTWGIQFWCQVPDQIEGTDITINIDVSDTDHWCDLTPDDIEVMKFYSTDNIEYSEIGPMDANINLTPALNPCSIPKQEFFTVYYAIKYEEDFEYMEIQTFTIRGYGYLGDTPIYVDNYHLFEDGSEDQYSTGWGSTEQHDSIAAYYANWITVLEEANDDSEAFDEALYIFASEPIITTPGMNPTEARRSIYSTICNATRAYSNTVWSDGISEGLDGVIGITYPSVDNNVSHDVIDLTTMFSYMYDDTCNPYD